MKVKITDESSKYFGQELDGDCIYYDVYHIGSTPEKPAIDLFHVNTPGGTEQFLSTQIDADHYWEQVRQEHIKNLGADVGDVVIIIETHSCWGNLHFDLSKPHIITDVDSSGYVKFDDGAFTCFRPIVKRFKGVD